MFCDRRRACARGKKKRKRERELLGPREYGQCAAREKVTKKTCDKRKGKVSGVTRRESDSERSLIFGMSLCCLVAFPLILNVRLFKLIAIVHW